MGFEDIQRRVPDITKIKKTFGWEPSIYLDEIIKDVFNHIKK
jgi:UDP-glucose 4-epimerase